VLLEFCRNTISSAICLSAPSYHHILIYLSYSGLNIFHRKQRKVFRSCKDWLTTRNVVATSSRRNDFNKLFIRFSFSEKHMITNCNLNGTEEIRYPIHLG